MEEFLRQLFVLLAVVNAASCQKHDRIVGGVPADIQTFNWQVSLRFQGAEACGASLIAPQWILTASHCFPSEHAVADYDAVLGTGHLDPADGGSVTVLIDQVFKYPGYTPEAYIGDIAVARLRNAVTLGPNIGIVRLLAADVQIPAGLSCFVTGWGNIRNGVTLDNPKPLQAGNVHVISSRTCQCLYNIKSSSSSSSNDHITSIQSDMLCAGNNGVDACQGDSGGPLSCSINNKWYQVGVVSWGDECAAENRPGVYIRITAYINWIQSYVTDCQAESVTIDQQSVPDDENGCKGADGQYYAYPNSASVLLVTFLSLPLYWLSAYVLTNL